MMRRDTEVLLVDDDVTLRTVLSRVLTRAGLKVEAVGGGEQALDLLRRGRRFHVVVTDLIMPRIGGLELLHHVRQLDLDVPVIIVTGNATLETALMTMEHGGFRYLQKPVENAQLVQVVKDAAAHHRLSLLKRKALEICEADGCLLGDLQELEAKFERALAGIWIAYQPIVSWPGRSVFGHEALVRSSDSELSNPSLLFDAAERLGRVQELGMRIRDAVSHGIHQAPADTLIFINIHPLDLTNDSLYALQAPLTAHAERIVLEVTERSSLLRIDELSSRIASLRDLGFQIAVDDLGAGYAGLSSFSQLEPDIVKLDMSLVRGIDGSSSKTSLVRSMVQVCTEDLGMRVVCEGVETSAERDTLERLGATLLQGYLFAKPERGFRADSLFPPL
jgi:EAL domain-containing protein (putative c-di-GMP-specific phosphodiesterase class I)/CheY-like chemotaxis protein